MLRMLQMTARRTLAGLALAGSFYAGALSIPPAPPAAPTVTCYEDHAKVVTPGAAGPVCVPLDELWTSAPCVTDAQCAREEVAR